MNQTSQRNRGHTSLLSFPSTSTILHSLATGFWNQLRELRIQAWVTATARAIPKLVTITTAAGERSSHAGHGQDPLRVKRGNGACNLEDAIISKGNARSVQHAPDLGTRPPHSSSKAANGDEHTKEKDGQKT